MHDSLSYQELKQRILRYTLERDWQQFHTPKNMALSLSLEANELLELFQWSLDNDIMSKRKDQLQAELADVFYWLIKLSHHYQIDLVQALSQKMSENEQKYPVDAFLGNSARHSELGS